MRRSSVLLVAVLAALPGCRKPPSEAEREWAQSLRAGLPPGWQVLVVTGDPENNRFVGWFEAPGPDDGTCRVELHVRPDPGAAGGRAWTVLVHPPNPRDRHGSVKFAVPDDGAGPIEAAGGTNDPDAVEAARPLAEEAVRQVRGLRLF